MFFSAYWSDIQGGKEIKGPGIKAKIILLLLWMTSAIQGMKKAFLSCFVY